MSHADPVHPAAAALRGRRQHLARRPVARAHHLGRPRRSSSPSATSSASPRTRRSSPARSPRATPTTTQLARARRGRRRRRHGGLRDHDRRRARRRRHLPSRLRRAPAATTAASRSRSRPASPTTPTARSRRRTRSGRRSTGPNAMIKIPATVEGLDAITAVDRRRASASTSRSSSASTATAPSSTPTSPASSRRKAAGIDLSTIHSVASFFVSRVDTEIDKRLDGDRHRRGARAEEQGRRRERAARLRALRARSSASERATALLEAGANRQRPLWASTGVKDPALPDTLYVTELVAARRRQHDAREDPRGDLRPRRDRTATPSPAPTPTAGAVLDALGARRRRLRRRDRACSSARASRSSSSRGTNCSTRSAARWRRRDELPHLRAAARPPTRSRRSRARASSPTSSRAASPLRTPTLWGPAAEDEASKRLGWTEAVAVSRPLVPEIEALARAARGRRRHAHRARRHGRLVARARGHHAHRTGRAHRARLDRARAGAGRARATGSRESALVDLVEVGLDGRDRQPAPRLRAGVPRRRHRPDDAHHRRDRPGLAARRVGPRRRLPRLQRRPDGRRPLLGAHRVRARAVRPRRRRHRRDPRRGRDDRALARHRQPREPGPRARRRDRRRRRPLRDKLAIVADGTHIVGFADWAEQLIAESTGKEGTGILPVVLDDRRARARRPTCPTCRSCASSTTPATRSSPTHDTGEIRGLRQPRRAAARLGVRHGGRRPPPRHQPVRPARRRVGEDRRARPARRPPRARARGVRRRRHRGARHARRDRRVERPRLGASTCCSRSCPRTGTSRCRPTSTASRTPSSRASATCSRRAPAGPSPSAGARASCTRPASSTRAARRSASSCRSREAPAEDLAIPDRPFTFGELIAAQASGDASVLADHGRPVLTLTLTDPAANIATLFDAVG